MEPDLAVKRLDALVRHINNVRSNCTLLGERLMEKGEIEFGKRLIANGFIHDNSKFSGVEWLYLHQDVKDKEPEKFKLAAEQHVNSNMHHPEYWQHISSMPRIYVAEMVCDCTARSQEFGDDIRDWYKDQATKKYDFLPQSKTYKQVKEFLDILLDPGFK